MDRFWEGQEFQPPIAEMMQLMEMVLSNADRQSWNSNHQWDPTSTYSEGYRERGTPEALAPFLAAYSQIVEPDLIGLVGDLARVPRMAGAIADVARVADEPAYQIVRNADGTPVRAYRVEAPGGGPGPIAQDLGLSGNARYYGDAEYASDFLRPDSLVLEGYPMARPGGYVDAARANGMDNVDLVARIEQSALDFAPPESRDFVTKVFNDYRAGTRDLTDVMNDLRHIYGHDMGPVPRSSGLDAMRQRVDDGRGVGEEIVTFGQERTFQNLNTYTGQEFRDLPLSSHGTQPAEISMRDKDWFDDVVGTAQEYVPSNQVPTLTATQPGSATLTSMDDFLGTAFQEQQAYAVLEDPKIREIVDKMIREALPPGTDPGLVTDDALGWALEYVSDKYYSNLDNNILEIRGDEILRQIERAVHRVLNP